MSRFVRVPEARTTPWGGRALKKVLVVEDEASIAGLIAYNIEQAGYRVQTATDGQAACRQAETFAPDAVTLDLLLPLVSGWQVLRFLRSHADRRLARVPVIVVSALGSARQRAELKRQGAQDCLEKPFSIAELSRLIHIHTSQATARNRSGRLATGLVETS